MPRFPALVFDHLLSRTCGSVVSGTLERQVCRVVYFAHLAGAPFNVTRSDIDSGLLLPPPLSQAPLRRCSCALRTAGFCFSRTPPPWRAWVPFQKMQPLPWEQRASRPPGCVPRDTGDRRKGDQKHVRKSSFTYWLSWQRRRSQNHPQQRILHGAFARDQAELEGPRDRRMEVGNHLAPDHRYMELKHCSSYFRSEASFLRKCCVAHRLDTETTRTRWAVKCGTFMLGMVSNQKPGL